MIGFIYCKDRLFLEGMLGGVIFLFFSQTVPTNKKLKTINYLLRYDVGVNIKIEV